MKKDRKSTPKAAREVTLPGVIAEGESLELLARTSAAANHNQLNPPDTFP